MDGIGWWICLQKFWKINLDSPLCGNIQAQSAVWSVNLCVKAFILQKSQCIFKRCILLLSLFPWYITSPALVLSRTHARDFKVKVNWGPSNPALIPHFSCGLHYVSLSINTCPHWPFLIRAVQPKSTSSMLYILDLFTSYVRCSCESKEIGKTSAEVSQENGAWAVS